MPPPPSIPPPSTFGAALRPLGYTKLAELADGAVVGFGVEQAEGQKPRLDFWVTSDALKEGAAQGYTHIAFRAKDRAAVDAFHKDGLAADGKDIGGPGIRAKYALDYYAAFLLDPAGNGIKVCHRTDV